MLYTDRNHVLRLQFAIYISPPVNKTSTPKGFATSRTLSGMPRKPARRNVAAARIAATAAARAISAAVTTGPMIARSARCSKPPCSDCGGVAELPFQPSGDRPVYCRDCWQASRVKTTSPAGHEG